MPPKTEAQFPLWTATDSLCRRYSVDLASPVSDVILRPTSFSSAKDLGPIAPIVSIAIGKKVGMIAKNNAVHNSTHL